MGDSARLARRRAALFEADPHCCYCGRELVHWKPAGDERLPGNFATIEHVNPRVGGPRPRDGKTTLACLDCNTRKGGEDEKAFREQAVHEMGSLHLTVPLGEMLPELGEMLDEAS